jgi:hypothetical protein
MFEEMFTDDNATVFNIYDNIIDKKSNDVFLVKLKFRDFLAYTNYWCFNRKICQDKVEELYNSLCQDYDIPFTLHAVYDEKHMDPVRKLLILDGQHRREAIYKYIEMHDKNWTCDYNVWIWVHKISDAETHNTSHVLELFKKINNNRVFEEDELPDTFIIDLVQQLCDVPLFKRKKVIGTNNLTNSCHAPCIHKKELNVLFSAHRELLKTSNKTVTELVENIQRINHKISLKQFDELYYASHRMQEKTRYHKAVDKGFFLNLKNSKFSPEIWIKLVCNPDGI